MSGRKRRVVKAALMSATIAAAVVASGIAGGSPASAESACGTLLVDHCYAVAAMGTIAPGQHPVYISGIGADLEVDCLAVGDDSAESATWEMWLSTDDTDPNATTDSGYWVEEGYLAGNAGAGPGFQWFMGGQQARRRL